MSTTKKFLSIILSILMAFSLFSVAVSAVDADEIKLDETVTITVLSAGAVYLKFVPEKSGKYNLVSYAEGEIDDPYCSLFNETLDEMLVSNDDANELNFCLTYDQFVEGETYYFEVSIFSEYEATFDVALECGHIYENGDCTMCGAVCDHTKVEFLGFCPCGEEYLGTDIKVGDEHKYDAKKYNNKDAWYRFIPEVSGAYYFEAFSDPDIESDPVCYLYDENGNCLAMNDDKSAEDYGFKLIFNFEAEDAYYFLVKNYVQDATYYMELSRVTHNADDASVHDDVEYVAATDPTCIDYGYTEGFFCLVCNEYFGGHEEFPINDYHNDDDIDGICDNCGEEIDYDNDMNDDDGINNDNGNGIDFMSFFQGIIAFFKNLISNFFALLGLM